jgi:thymidylate synthase (FAD)
MEVQLKTITPNAEINIVEIARVSSTRLDKSEKPEGLINYLIKNKHWSPFQHSYITFEIITSKAIGIQLLRHLSFTFQEFSQRYAEVDNIEPIEFRVQAEKNRQSSTDVIGNIIQMKEQEGMDNVFIVNLDVGYEEQNQNNQLPRLMKEWLDEVAINLENTLNLYKKGIKLGVAKECARMILPMATQTTLYMTGSIRSWIHFLQIRTDYHAQKEVRLVAEKIKRLFIEECPIISSALTLTYELN